MMLRPDLTTTDMLDVRDWLRDALYAHGARITGSGIGNGGADVDIELPGWGHFLVHLRPLDTPDNIDYDYLGTVMATTPVPAARQAGATPLDPPPDPKPA